MRLASIAAPKALIWALALSLPLAACHKGPDPKIAAAKAAATQSEGEAFLAKNAMEPGVVTLPTGVQYKIVTSGLATGNSPRRCLISGRLIAAHAEAPSVNPN